MTVRRSLPALETRWIAGAIALAVATLLVGCSSLAVVKFDKSDEEKRRARELQSLLERYTRDFAQTIELAADGIVASVPDLETKRATVYWKLETIPRVHELSRVQASNGETLLALWLFTEFAGHYYEEGEGGEVFGAGQPIAVAAGKELRTKIESVARQALDSEEDFAEAKRVIHDYVQRYIPRRSNDGSIDYGTIEAGIQELTASAGDLEWVPSFSLDAFNPFKGLDESAAAIRHFTNESMALIEDVYTQLPWRVELLLYDIEGRDTVLDTTADLKRFTDSTVALAAAADRLPDDVKGVVRTTLDEIDVKQEGLRQTLQQTEDALIRAEGLVSGLRDTAAFLTEAGNAWDATFQTLGLGEEKEAAPGASTEPQGRPFDILEYRDTAEELRNVALELRGLVQDVHALTGTGDDGAPLRNIELAAQTAAAAAIGEGRELVDHAALRLFQLVGVIFVVAILYRLVVVRFGPRPQMPGS